MLKTGHLVSGKAGLYNVLQLSFLPGATICAERTAIVKAVVRERLANVTSCA